MIRELFAQLRRSATLRPPALLLALAPASCLGDPSEPVVEGRVEIVGTGTAELDPNTVQWLDGTYGGGCVSRAGNWSLRVSGNATMDYTALTVLQNNSACTLTITKVAAASAYTASPSLSLATSYQGSASTFGSPTAFYGNAVISSTSFASNFTVTLAVSDNANLGTGSTTGTYASVNGTASASAATSPNYTLDVNTGALTVNTDASYNVSSVTGYAVLTTGTVAGTGYYVDQGTLPSSPNFAQLDSGYAGATTTAISGANPQVAAAAFGLAGLSLSSSIVRTIVIQRLVSGVKSYQTFTITFSHP